MSSTSIPSVATPKKVAIIGCGIGGLSSAWLLSRSQDYHITLYEKETRLGGHSNTVDVSTIKYK